MQNRISPSIHQSIKINLHKFRLPSVRQQHGQAALLQTSYSLSVDLTVPALAKDPLPGPNIPVDLAVAYAQAANAGQAKALSNSVCASVSAFLQVTQQSLSSSRCSQCHQHQNVKASPPCPSPHPRLPFLRPHRRSHYLLRSQSQGVNGPQKAPRR